MAIMGRLYRKTNIAKGVAGRSSYENRCIKKDSQKWNNCNIFGALHLSPVLIASRFPEIILLLKNRTTRVQLAILGILLFELLHIRCDHLDQMVFFTLV